MRNAVKKTEKANTRVIQGSIWSLSNASTTYGPAKNTITPPAKTRSNCPVNTARRSRAPGSLPRCIRLGCNPISANCFTSPAKVAIGTMTPKSAGVSRRNKAMLPRNDTSFMPPSRIPSETTPRSARSSRSPLRATGEALPVTPAHPGVGPGSGHKHPGVAVPTGSTSSHPRDGALRRPAPASGLRRSARCEARQSRPPRHSKEPAVRSCRGQPVPRLRSLGH